MELKKIDAQEFATLPNFDVEYEDSAYAGEMSEKAYNVLASACDNAHSGYFEEMLQDLYLDQALLAREMDAKGAFARIVKRLYEHGVASRLLLQPGKSLSQYERAGECGGLRPCG